MTKHKYKITFRALYSGKFSETILELMVNSDDPKIVNMLAKKEAEKLANDSWNLFKIEKIQARAEGDVNG